MGALIAEYKQAPEFLDLRDTTRKGYLGTLDRFQEMHEVAVADIRRRHVLRMRDNYADKPGIANAVITLWSVLMQFAVEREYIIANPAQGIKRPKLGEWERWPDQAIAVSQQRFPEMLRRAVVLAFHTGQRESDLIAMSWADYDGSFIQVTQAKTGVRLWIPCHTDLKSELDAWKVEAAASTIPATTILTKPTGLPWNRDTFSNAISRELKRHPELKGLVFHGLRKAAAATLAEAGCTPHEIASITGHRSLKNIELYTRQAEQRVRATAAITKLENFRRKM